MNWKIPGEILAAGIVLISVVLVCFQQVEKPEKKPEKKPSAPLTPPAPLTPSEAEKSHFGTLAFDYKYVPLTMSLDQIEAGFEKEAKAAAEAGAYWIRPHYTEAFNWGFIEREQGEYDWTIPDLLVKTVQKYNLHLLIQFWSGPRAEREEGVRSPFWVVGADKWSYPSDMQAYLAWLKAMVERYDGDGEKDMPGLRYPVVYYEVINEPCLDNEEEKEKYFDLLKRSYPAIKEVNPEIQVLVGGLLEMEIQLKILLEGGMAPYFDVMNGHLTHSWREALAIAREHAAENKPMWVTETWHTDIKDLYQAGISLTLEKEKDHARWLVQTHVLQFGEGVEKIFHVEILGNIRPPTGVEWPEMGQLGSCLYPEDEGRPRLAYFTYKLLASKIGRFESAKTINSAEFGLGTYEFVQDGNKIYILWVGDESGMVELQTQRVELQTQSQRARVTNLVPLNKEGMFEFFEIEAKNGKITLDVGQDPLLVEGIL